jgi:hypothetical protein
MSDENPRTSSANKYYVANRERILANSKERYKKKTETEKENTRLYQREYYRHLRSLYNTLPAAKPLAQPRAQVEKPQVPVVPAVKENKSDIIPTFN